MKCCRLLYGRSLLVQMFRHWQGHRYERQGGADRNEVLTS